MCGQGTRGKETNGCGRLRRGTRRGIWARFMDGYERTGRETSVARRGEEMYGCWCLCDGEGSKRNNGKRVEWTRFMGL